MEILVKVYNRGVCVYTLQRDLFPGPKEPRILTIDISGYVNTAIAAAASVPDTSNPPEKELDKNDGVS